jgi:hypothetical protein
MPTVGQAIKGLQDFGLLSFQRPESLRSLDERFKPPVRGSVRSLLAKMLQVTPPPEPIAWHPFYRRKRPVPQNPDLFASDGSFIDFRNAHLPAYGEYGTAAFDALFDARAAAAVQCNVAHISFNNVQFIPSSQTWRNRYELIDPFTDLLELKTYGDDAPDVFVARNPCLAAMAYGDYFPGFRGTELRRAVSAAIMVAGPGWCGTFGPGVDGTFDLLNDPSEGNYDMSEMHLLAIAYRYYDELTPPARDRLINLLLAQGIVHRPRLDDTFTSGMTPHDWSRAGFVSPGSFHIRIGETENHIFAIVSARYLTNQLLYQRSPEVAYDNRRNGSMMLFGREVATDSPNTTDLLLRLLREILRCDFSEYNAKPYQSETRKALLNLCNYAYDHEVRLAARMALDYISAHIAVSTNDLRRMVPFRRRNEERHGRTAQIGNTRFMDVALLEASLGADPLTENFAMLSGNLRALESPNPPSRAIPWTFASNGEGAVADALSDYRLPPSVHDLFVNEPDRRFFQRLHRTVQADEIAGTNAMDGVQGSCGRNVDNMEIYASSPSYLIAAGGEPATYAIDPYPSTLTAKGLKKSKQQLGVAVTTSFMPTGQIAGLGTQNMARDVIQFSMFSDVRGEVANYGVAPDFACGHRIHLPFWALSTGQIDGQFTFIDRGSTLPGKTDPAGFYLAIFDDGRFAFLEAFDTWLHPGTTFQDFKARVKAANPRIAIRNNEEFRYTTQNGNVLHFVIWHDVPRDGALFGPRFGAEVVRIEYGALDVEDRIGDAGNVTGKFLNGTVLNSFEEGVVEITNPRLGTKVRLDMSDPKRPRRTSESGVFEEAGTNHEVWVNFAWEGPNEGDFFRPFSTLAAAVAAVADGGTVKIAPGWTHERPLLAKGKKVRIVAPLRSVKFGVR